MNESILLAFSLIQEHSLLWCSCKFMAPYVGKYWLLCLSILIDTDGKVNK